MAWYEYITDREDEFEDDIDFFPRRCNMKQIKGNKTVERDYGTIGVRFSSNPSTIYTYGVSKKVQKKLKLGDELVVENERGTSVVFVVRIDKNPDLTFGADLKRITKKVVVL
jgi:hypothetical protein